jgi:hypothetical protein
MRRYLFDSQEEGGLSSGSKIDPRLYEDFPPFTSLHMTVRSSSSNSLLLNRQGDEDESGAFA